jgi:hypothetical protein
MDRAAPGRAPARGAPPVEEALPPLVTQRSGSSSGSGSSSSGSFTQRGPPGGEPLVSRGAAPGLRSEGGAGIRRGDAPCGFSV